MKSKEKKQLYTWVACVFVVLLLLSIAVPMLSGGKKESISNKYKDSYYDLANMPFSTDEAVDALMASARYDDIGKSDLMNALFSKKDKEERQAQDEAEGVPPPPDEDYKQAEQAKAAAAARAARPAVSRGSGSRMITPTQKGSLSSGGRLNTGGGGGGVSATLPTRSDNKNSGPKAINSQTLAKSMDNLNKGGRASGFVDTYAKTKAAAENKDISGKAGGAADAFQNGNAASSDGALEAAAAELGFDPNSMRPTNAEGLGDLKQQLEDARDDGLDNKKCETIFSAGSWFGECFFTELGTQMVSVGPDLLKDYLGKGDKETAGDFALKNLKKDYKKNKCGKKKATDKCDDIDAQINDLIKIVGGNKTNSCPDGQEMKDKKCVDK
jgi:hypothetical protein